MAADWTFSGVIYSTAGLRPVADALQAGGLSIELWRSGYDNTFLLRSKDDTWSFDMQSGQTDMYLFSGGTDRGVDVPALIAAFSKALAHAGIPHEINLDCSELVAPLDFLFTGIKEGQS